MTTLDEPEVTGASLVPHAAPLLECRGICKRFGAVEALVDVDFEVYPGEVVALVGDNGAGKSTLIKAIAGTQPADSGTFMFDGRRVSIRNPGDANKLGIETVYQDLRCATTSTRSPTSIWAERPPGRAGRPGRCASCPSRRWRNVRASGCATRASRRSRACASAWARCPAGSASRSPSLAPPSGRRSVVFEVADRIVVLYMGRRSATFQQRSTTPREVVEAIVGLNAARS